MSEESRAEVVDQERTPVICCVLVLEVSLHAITDVLRTTRIEFGVSLINLILIHFTRIESRYNMIFIQKSGNAS